MQQLELDIQKVLDGVAKRSQKGDDWTEMIMCDLTCLAYEKGYYVYGQKCGKIDNTITGCLYDMAWYTPMPLDYLPEKNKNSIFDILHLVLECEWLRDMANIMYDFQKLVQARAELRVMIFWSNQTELVFKRLMDYVEAASHAVKGDRYLLAGLDSANGEFSFRSLVKT